MKLFSKNRSPLSDDRGFATSEYVLGFGLIVVVVVGSVGYFGGQTATLLNTVSVGISDEIAVAGGVRWRDPTEGGGGGDDNGGDKKKDPDNGDPDADNDPTLN